ncbi:hypothetical protein GOP47_0010314 [Adiantum capillus-veneris]|uniref:Ribosomal RNA-processing protein 40 n=1 Tax=Adiantum capillus-veneris TaxID=13818 RepID=A0A9D4UUH4_ADICA|nr:hypothetical protein GOP47_0010314 [Adiantum capillus-veneris]
MEMETRDNDVKRSSGQLESSPYINKIVAPGDIVLDLGQLSIPTLRLGGGLRQDQDLVIATKAGRLKFIKPNKVWVEGSQKRYIPSLDDVVIGLVVDRRSESFTVDIGGPVYASLSIFLFEGATRRNIPNLQAGSVLYMRVVKAHRDMTPEVSCVDAMGKASGFGQLKDGFVFQCSTGLARALLSRPTCPVLEALGKGLSFEIAVGVNGRVWVNGDSVSTIILVSNAIMNAEFLSAAQQQLMVQKLLQRVQ